MKENKISENRMVKCNKQLNHALRVDAQKTFILTWKNIEDELPKEGGRYWCLVRELNDLGTSYFQWNCSYHETEKRWSDNHENYNVIYWTELAPIPF